MTAITADVKESKTLFSPTKKLISYFVISSLATLFDAYSSWLIIAVNPIALEGNPIWGSIASVFGFGGAMVVRAIAGVIMVLILWGLSNQTRHLGARRYARFGLRAVTVVLLLLTAYHIVGTLYFG